MSERAFVGSDLKLGVNHDLVVENGDLAVIEGDACLRGNLIDRLHTSPGGVLWNPEFGAGLLDLLGEVMSDEELLDFAVAAKFQIEEDPRVLRVVECQAFRGTDEGPDEDAKAVYLRWVVETADGQVEGNVVFQFPIGGSTE